MEYPHSQTMDFAGEQIPPVSSSCVLFRCYLFGVSLLFVTYRRAFLFRSGSLGWEGRGKGLLRATNRWRSRRGGASWTPKLARSRSSTEPLQRSMNVRRVSTRWRYACSRLFLRVSFFTDVFFSPFSCFCISFVSLIMILHFFLFAYRFLVFICVSSFLSCFLFRFFLPSAFFLLGLRFSFQGRTSFLTLLQQRKRRRTRPRLNPLALETISSPASGSPTRESNSVTEFVVSVTGRITDSQLFASWRKGEKKKKREKQASKQTNERIM